MESGREWQGVRAEVGVENDELQLKEQVEDALTDLRRKTQKSGLMPMQLFLFSQQQQRWQQSDDAASQPGGGGGVGGNGPWDR